MSEQDSNNSKRSFERISVENLPESLRSFLLRFENGVELIVKTIDASSIGIGLHVPLPVYAITEFNVTLESLAGDFTVSDEIVYVKAMNPGSSRVSIKFSKPGNLEKYKNLFKQANS